jgi:hypothetical protein
MGILARRTPSLIGLQEPLPFIAFATTSMELPLRCGAPAFRKPWRVDYTQATDMV